MKHDNLRTFSSRVFWAASAACLTALSLACSSSDANLGGAGSGGTTSECGTCPTGTSCGLTPEGWRCSSECDGTVTQGSDGQLRCVTGGAGGAAGGGDADCAGKTCGATCAPSCPSGGECNLPAGPWACDTKGECITQSAVTCSGAGGATGYQPCAGLATGATCSPCPPGAACNTPCVTGPWTCTSAGLCDAPSCGAAGAAGGVSCAAWDVHEVPCDHVGPTVEYWDGKSCKKESFCACTGADCKKAEALDGSCEKVASECTTDVCAGKTCGETCTPYCPPNAECNLPAGPWACDVKGECITQSAVTCAGAGSAGGAGGAGGATQDPCAGKACGEACVYTCPADPGCNTPAGPTACDAKGECVTASTVTCGSTGDECGADIPPCTEAGFQMLMSLGGLCSVVACDPDRMFCTSAAAGVTCAARLCDAKNNTCPAGYTCDIGAVFDEGDGGICLAQANF